MNDSNRGIPSSVIKVFRSVLGQFGQAVSSNQELQGNITNTLDRYLGDSLWPSNFRELERSLDRLSTGLSKHLRILLISNREIFTPLYDELSEDSVIFLQYLQEHYSHKYKVGAHKTVFLSNSRIWDSINVQPFQKDNSAYYGLSIVRMDGEHVYFEGSRDSISHMIKIIQEAMDAHETLVPKESANA